MVLHEGHRNSTILGGVATRRWG